MNEVDRDKIEVVKQTCNAILRYLQNRSEEYFLNLIPESSKFHPNYVESGSMIWDSIASPESKPRSPKLEEEIKEELKLPEPMKIEEEVKVEDLVEEEAKVKLPVMKEAKEPEIATALEGKEPQVASVLEIKEPQLASVLEMKESEAPPVEEVKEDVTQKTNEETRELSEPEAEFNVHSELKVETKHKKLIASISVLLSILILPKKDELIRQFHQITTKNAKYSV